MPELRNASDSNLIPNMILVVLTILTVVFAMIGYMIRKRYKHLDSMINKELGENAVNE